MKKYQASAREKRSFKDEDTDYTAPTKTPILLAVYIHGDLDEYDINKLYDDYFSWMRTELQDISGRNVDITFNTQAALPALANFHYQDPGSSDSLYRWKLTVDEITSKAKETKPYHPHLNKFLLITRHPINRGALGVAQSKGQCGIALIGDYMTPAHEVGHMFGATHEDADVIYNGWWYDTIMKHASTFKGNYYRFSDKNRENIRNYLSQFD